MLDEFINYLIEEGYAKSTVYDYIERVSKISERESVLIPKLAENISFYVEKYGPTGKESEFGKKSHNAFISALKQFQNYLSEIARIKEEKDEKKAKRVKQFMDSGSTRSEALYRFYKENPDHDRNKYKDIPRPPNTSVERMIKMSIEEDMKRYEMTREEATKIYHKKEEEKNEKYRKRREELIETGMDEKEAADTELWERYGLGLSPKEREEFIKKQNSGCLGVLLMLIAPTILLSLLVF